jgi:hypothetical protein
MMPMIPGEAAAVEAFRFASRLVGLFEKLVDGQTDEQRRRIWDQWITFWQPLVNLMATTQGAGEQTERKG